MKLNNIWGEIKGFLRFKYIVLCIVGSGILAFGLFNVHQISGVTEGGILGMTLLLKHWFNLSPSVSSFIMNLICYITGWKVLGHSFIVYSGIASISFSSFYSICEQIGPLWLELANMPFAAALLGALFVGVGTGLCVIAGGAPSGDDAIAMIASLAFKIDIRWAYIFSDVLVLLLSISYLGWNRIAFSLLTVILSGQLIGIINRLGEKLKVQK